jgi:hypothetical protein
VRITKSGPTADLARLVSAFQKVFGRNRPHTPATTASERDAALPIFKWFLERNQHIARGNTDNRRADRNAHLRINKPFIIREHVVASIVNNRGREVWSVLVCEADTPWLLLRWGRQTKGDVNVSPKLL